MFRRVVVPLDGSPLAEAILPHVRRLAADTSLEVLLLSIAPAANTVGELATGVHDSLGHPSLAVSQLDEVLAEEGEILTRYVEAQARQLVADGLAATAEVRWGVAADEIVRYAEEADADAIAMCTHGRTGLDRLLNGSVAEAVLRHSRRPVLLLRPDPAAFEAATRGPAVTEVLIDAEPIPRVPAGPTEPVPPPAAGGAI